MTQKYSVFSWRNERKQRVWQVATMTSRHGHPGTRRDSQNRKFTWDEVPRGMTFPCSVGSCGDEKSIVNKVNSISTKTQRIHLNYYKNNIRGLLWEHWWPLRLSKLKVKYHCFVISWWFSTIQINFISDFDRYFFALIACTQEGGNKHVTTLYS